MDVVSQFRQRMLLVVVGCLGLAALLSAAIVIGGSVSGTAGKVIASVFLIPLASLFALAGAAVRERVPALGLATITANAVAALALQAWLWTGGGNNALGQIAVGLGALAIYGSLVSLVVSRSRATDTSGVRVAEWLGFAGLGALTLVVAHFSLSFHEPSHDALKLAGVAAIVGILGILAAPLVRLANRGSALRPVALASAPALDGLIGMRVVAVNGEAQNVLVFENGARVQLR
jgi:hypothetical protein